MTTILLRTGLLYILLLCTFRLMGKRQIGQLETSELITTLLISEIATMPIADPDIPLLYSVLPILFICCTEIIFTFGKTRSGGMKKMLESMPVILIAKGEILKDQLSRVRLTVDELISECRQMGVWHVDDIDYAILEQNGKISVLPKSSKNALTPSDMSLKVEDKGMDHPLVIDGKIIENSICSEKHIKKLCGECGAQLQDILYMSADDKGNITVKTARKEKKS